MNGCGKFSFCGQKCHIGGFLGGINAYYVTYTAQHCHCYTIFHLTPGFTDTFLILTPIYKLST